MVVCVEGHDRVSEALHRDGLDQLAARVLADAAVLVPAAWRRDQRERRLSDGKGQKIGIVNRRGTMSRQAIDCRALDHGTNRPH